MQAQQDSTGGLKEQPAAEEAGEQVAELKAQLKAEAGFKQELLERVHHLETQVILSQELCSAG